MMKRKNIQSLNTCFVLVMACGLAGAVACDSKSDDAVFPSYENDSALSAAVKATVATFAAAMKADGATNAAGPPFRIETTPYLVFFDGESVVVPRWSEVPTDVRSRFAVWAGSEKDARELFNSTFQWFFWAHELGHWVQQERGVLWDSYERELHANEVAVAFWKGQPDGTRKLARLRELVSAALPRMTPKAGKTIDRAMFDKNYSALSTDVDGYGYVQFTMVLDAIDRASALDRKTLSVSRTAGGIDCAAAGPKITASCPSVKDGVGTCVTTVDVLSSQLRPACLEAAKAFASCYSRASAFSCGSQDEPPLPTTCDVETNALVMCIDANP